MAKDLKGVFDYDKLLNYLEMNSHQSYTKESIASDTANILIKGMLAKRQNDNHASTYYTNYV